MDSWLCTTNPLLFPILYMMNPKIIIVVILFFAIQITVCGQVSFPLNVSGKIEISDVVVDSVKKEDLYRLAGNWFNSMSKTTGTKVKALRRDSLQGNISGNLEFMIYTDSGVLQRLLGAVTCDLELDVKDNKYRYVYTNLVFHEFKQDRYYQYVSTGKTKPFEEPAAMGFQDNWEKCKESTNKKISNQIASLKAGMIQRNVVTRKKQEW